MGSLPANNLDEESGSETTADRIRSEEKFLVVKTGETICKICGYTSTRTIRDIDDQSALEQLSARTCPTCGAPGDMIEFKTKVVSGFAENQGYGLGTNSLTSDQKSILIYGTL